MHRGERIVINGENNSGKSLVVFDNVATLIENGHKVLLITDLYSESIVKKKLAYALLRIRNGRRPTLDPSDSELNDIISKTIKHPIIKVATSDILFDDFKLESKFDEYDFDAVFVDEDISTYHNGREFSDLLLKLSELTVKYNVLTSYVLHGKYDSKYDRLVDTKIVTSKEGLSLTATKLTGLTEVSDSIFIF